MDSAPFFSVDTKCSHCAFFLSVSELYPRKVNGSIIGAGEGNWTLGLNVGNVFPVLWSLSQLSLALLLSTLLCYCNHNNLQQSLNEYWIIDYPIVQDLSVITVTKLSPAMLSQQLTAAGFAGFWIPNKESLSMLSQLSFVPRVRFQ